MIDLSSLPHFEENVVLAPYTGFKIGGPARYFFRVLDSQEIPVILKAAYSEDIPVLVLGGGYNILVSDKGFDGVVIVNTSADISIRDTSVTADSGVSLPVLIQKTLDTGLVGLEYLFGIPGTVGGAIRGNAGVPGHEIGTFVQNAVVTDTEGGMKTVDQAYFQFGYRESALKKNSAILLSVQLQLQKGDAEQAKKVMREMRESRSKKQPAGKSCGSFFKNPSKEQPAGMLIDQCGLKGYRIGDALVSPYHANFIMNAGNATFQDMIRLTEHVKKEVYNKFKITLEEEVQIIREK